LKRNIVTIFDERCGFQKLNLSLYSHISRWRQVPTFGRDTIRRISGDVSALRKLAARDYEDYLQVSIISVCTQISILMYDVQCAMPVFEDLMHSIPFNNLILDLLYILATWHAYSKCRIHTETSVSRLESATKTLGHLLRVFARETAKMNIQETPREREAEARREGRADKVRLESGKAPRTKETLARRSRKTFNLITAKLHALGHVAARIRMFGTSDNYSTQTVSCLVFPLLAQIRHADTDAGGAAASLL
jgi:hypothetical protein